MQVEPSGIMLCDGIERRPASLVALDGDNASGTLQQQRAREPARSRPDLDDRAAFEGSRGAGDAPRQIEIEDEVLAQALAGRETERPHDVAQRRQPVGSRWGA